MINYSNCSFIKSCPSKAERPQTNMPEVLIVGKSNVGKSSLINTLTSRKRLAFTSGKPGHTRLLNYYDIDHKFYLVDAPGYGYAKGGLDLDALFGEMMEDYFSNNSYLKLVLLLIDSRRTFKDNDLEILNFVKDENIPYYIVFTKTDKINQSEKAALIKHIKECDIPSENCYFTSSLEVRSVGSLKNAIEKVI